MATPFTTFGYPPTIEAGEWPVVAPVISASPYGVQGGWNCTIGPGTRQVQIRDGRGWGRGIYDILPSGQSVTVTLDPVSSGSRWDMITIRRDWNTEETNVAVIQVGATPIVPQPPVRKTYLADNIDDQPIWLVEVKSNGTIGALIDLRVWASAGGVVANHGAALQYLTEVGTQVRIGDVMWSRVFDPVGGAIWVASTIGDTGWLAFPGIVTDSDFTASSEPEFILYYRRLNGMVLLRGSLRRATPTAGFVTALQLPVGFRPAFPVWHQPRDGVTVSIQPSGAVQVLMTIGLATGAAVALGGISFPVV